MGPGFPPTCHTPTALLTRVCANCILLGPQMIIIQCNLQLGQFLNYFGNYNTLICKCLPAKYQMCSFPSILQEKSAYEWKGNSLWYTDAHKIAKALDPDTWKTLRHFSDSSCVVLATENKTLNNFIIFDVQLLWITKNICGNISHSASNLMELIWNMLNIFPFTDKTAAPEGCRNK